MAEGHTDIPKVKVVENLTGEQATQYEIAWIAALGRKDRGGILLNLTDGGDGQQVGYVHSQEAKAKNGAAHRGAKRSEQGRANIVAGITGRKLSSEHKAKISRIKSGTTYTDKTKAKVSASLIGNKRKLGFRDPPETRERKSAAQLRRQELLRQSAATADKRRPHQSIREQVCPRTAVRVGPPD